MIRTNPAARAQLPHREASEADDEADEPPRVFTAEQTAAILDAVRLEHRPLVELVASTGLRIGEALALRTSDLRLDAIHPNVRVRRSITPTGRVKSTKNRVRRSVPLSASLVRTMRVHLLAVRPTPSEWLFPSKSAHDTPLLATNTRAHILRPALVAAGITEPRVGWHRFRHTVASRLLARGDSISTVAQLLGDTPTTVERVCAHALPDDPPAPLELDVEGEQKANARDASTVTQIHDSNPPQARKAEFG